MPMLIVDYDFVRQMFRRLITQFVYVTDRQRHGVDEYWESDDALAKALRGMTFHGDCEEFARTCMLTIRTRSNLKARLVVCRDETGAGHCVCEVSNHDGTDAFILDNRQKQLMAFDRLKGYQFLMASPWNPEPGDQRPWVELKTA